MREITLSEGNPPLRLYDTSGPHTDPNHTVDLKLGLPPLRREWILARATSSRHASGGRPGPGAPSRRCTTRDGAEITHEMEFVAIREGLPPELVRDEVARGRAIIPANVNHPDPSR